VQRGLRCRPWNCRQPKSISYPPLCNSSCHDVPFWFIWVMSKIIPPLKVYNPDLTKAIGLAYRKAYRECRDGKPHAAGMSAAWQAFIMSFPFPNEAMAREVIGNILKGIEQKVPGWLSSEGPKRYPSSNDDARAEAEDVGRQWY